MQVITEQQARKITGGRKPLVPIEYEEACKALVACETLDEAKYWSDKSDALAAWAKIYSNDEAGRKARRLKLHAYRRMGILAGELRPKKYCRPSHTGQRGQLPGPAALLREQGLSVTQAGAARKLSGIPQQQFNQLVSREKPPAPTQAASMLKFSDGVVSNIYRVLQSARGAVRGLSPRIAATKLRDHAKTLKTLSRELSEWLDEFEQALGADEKP